MRLKRVWKITFCALLSAAVLAAGGYLLIRKSASDTFVVCAPARLSGLEEFVQQRWPGVSVTYRYIERYDAYMENNLTEEQMADYERLQVEIMSGSGPDLYILPSYTTRLLGNPYQAAANGMFLDLTDAAQESDHFAQCTPAVMAGGTLGDRQYFVPLSFDLPVAVCDDQTTKTLRTLPTPTQWLEELRALPGGAQDLYNLSGVGIFSMRPAPALNWAVPAVEPDAETWLKPLLEQRRQIIAGYSGSASLPSQSPERHCWTTFLGRAYDEGGVAAFLQNTADDTWEILSFPDAEGGSSACVMSYAAVPSNCRSPEIAQAIIFDYLLSEEVQGPGESTLMAQKGFVSACPVRADCIPVLLNRWQALEGADAMRPAVLNQIQKVYDNVRAAYLWDYETELIEQSCRTYLWEDAAELDAALDQLLTALETELAE